MATFALGVWLMAAPAILAYGGAAASNDRIFGPIVAAFAFIAAWEVTRAVRWANLPIGIWLAVAPLVLAYPMPAFASTLVSGVLVAALSLVRRPVRHRYGGGWSGLLGASRRP